LIYKSNSLTTTNSVVQCFTLCVAGDGSVAAGTW